MSRNLSIPLIIWFVTVILQLLLFNQMEFFGEWVPFVYPFVFIVFPFQLNRALFMTMGFITGLMVDVSFMTGGVHAGATVLLIMFKDFLYTVTSFKLQKDGVHFPLHIAKIGLGSMFSISALLLLAHHMYLHVFAYFNASFFYNLYSVVINVFISLLFILTFDLIVSKRIAIE